MDLRLNATRRSISLSVYLVLDLEAGQFKFLRENLLGAGRSKMRLCPGVPVHRGNNYCTPLFTSLCLAVAYCWVYCIGSCVPAHEDRTENEPSSSTLDSLQRAVRVKAKPTKSLKFTIF